MTLLVELTLLLIFTTAITIACVIYEERQDAHQRAQARAMRPGPRPGSQE